LDNALFEALAKRVALETIAALRDNPLPPVKYMTHAEAADFLRMGPRQLDQLHREGKGPPVHRATAGIRIYKIAELERWAERKA
jgi:hypothetical protein